MNKPRVRMEMEGVDKLVDQFNALTRTIETVVLEAAIAGAEVIAQRANQNLGRGDAIQTRVDTGQTTKDQAFVWIGLIDEKWFYRFIEYGTSAHEVSPKTAQALRFFMANDDIYSMENVVSGIPANPFLRPAIDQSRGMVNQEMSKVYNSAILRVVK
jgi:HK97 gp10 family phage protein